MCPLALGRSKEDGNLSALRSVPGCCVTNIHGETPPNLEGFGLCARA